jgi:hypothetical protein
MFKIHDQGFWEGEDSRSKHYFDKPLYESILDFLKNHNIQTVLDLGCGLGEYAKAFRDNGFLCDCYDGNPDTPLLTNGLCECFDLSKDISLDTQYDCVISLEVGEHIPSIYEAIFINNIVKHTKSYIVLSWAVPFQQGDGHVNCRDNEYIINALQNHSFNFLPDHTKSMRLSATLPWFKNTIMIFEKN